MRHDYRAKNGKFAQSPRTLRDVLGGWYIGLTRKRRIRRNVERLWAGVR